ncbi:MAG: cob(I)yrinic acid a,c-diamide adenosyltransferase [Candidatus Daviesbacteria bacterium]
MRRQKKNYTKQERGLVIVYTGEGKGKTTAALGLALRAAGYHKRVLIIQFGKNWFSGEIESLKKLEPFVQLLQEGNGFVGIRDDKKSFKEHKKTALLALDKLKKATKKNEWDIIIADEIIGAVAGKLLSVNQVCQLIKNKQKGLDLVLTGRHASPRIIAKADLVTEMREIKHPFKKGFLAKKGIDF